MRHAADNRYPMSVQNPSWKLKLDAGIYEAAVERLKAEGSPAAEAEVNRLMSQFLAHLAFAGRDKSFRSCAWWAVKATQFAAERKRQVEAEFQPERAQECLRLLASNPNFGCDGGNWQSSLWVFGLEAGGTMQVDDEDGVFVDLTPRLNPNQVPESEIPEDASELAEWFDAYPYNRYLLRFCLSFFGLCTQEELKQGSKLSAQELADRAVKAKLFTPDGPCFKGNVYPLQRPSHAFWNRLSVRYKGYNFGPIERVLGFGLEQYKAEVINARKPALAEKIKANADAGRPTVIVCWGINSLGHFADAFGASMTDFEAVLADVFGRKTPMFAEIKAFENAWLFVMPHYQGLAYVDEWAYATALRKKLKEKYVPEFWNLTKQGPARQQASPTEVSKKD